MKILDPDIGFKTYMVGEALARPNLIFDRSGRRTLFPFFNGDHETPMMVEVVDHTVVRTPMGPPWSPEESLVTGWSILDRFKGGYLIKDVCQPWLVSEYLHGESGYIALQIRRHLADVAYLMAANDMWGPCRMADVDEIRPPEVHLIQGLVRAQVRYLDQHHSADKALDWDALTTDPNLLWDRLSEMGYVFDEWDWYGRRQERERDRQLRMRDTKRWKALASLVEQFQKKEERLWRRERRAS